MRYVMIRAQSQEREDFDLFFKQGVVAMGWRAVDFSTYDDTDELLAEAKRQYFQDSDTAPQVVGRKLGEIRLFRSLEVNDLVVVPHWSSIAMARVASDASTFSTDQLAIERDLVNQRSVKYLRDSETGEVLDIPRAELSEGLARRLRVMGSTALDLGSFADELEDRWNGRAWQDKYSESRDSERRKQIGQLKERIGFQGKTNLAAGGEGLEQLVKEILEICGYDVRVPAKNSLPPGADIDLEATWDDGFGLGSLSMWIQVKHHFGQSGHYGAQQLMEAKEHRGMDETSTIRLALVTTGDLDEESRQFCEQRDIQLLDLNAICNWIIDNGHRLSEQTRTKLGIAVISQVMDI